MIINDYNIVPISGSEYYNQAQQQNSNYNLNYLRDLYIHYKFGKILFKKLFSLHDESKWSE